ncbi:MAG: GNAT family N-acetyltransferase [Prevotella sp.]|nr:GNAT family N-acetyltransferase [Prevotella sp.]
MKEIQITAQNASEQVRMLYESAFPDEEEIPWSDLLRLIDVMPLDFTTYYEGAELVGMTIVYQREKLNWFWYFAVPEPLRGQGYGQQILTRLVHRYADRPMILDMESPEQPSDNLEQRRRRHAFYLRNGFRDTGVGRTFDTIAYTIMMTGEGQFTLQDYDDILADLRRHWWPDLNEE